MFASKGYDLDEVLDKCCVDGWVLWIFDRKRHKRNEPAFRVECDSCANAIDWQPTQSHAMTTWNKQQRNI